MGEVAPTRLRETNSVDFYAPGRRRLGNFLLALIASLGMRAATMLRKRKRLRSISLALISPLLLFFLNSKFFSIKTQKATQAVNRSFTIVGQNISPTFWGIGYFIEKSDRIRISFFKKLSKNRLLRKNWP